MNYFHNLTLQMHICIFVRCNFIQLSMLPVCMYVCAWVKLVFIFPQGHCHVLHAIEYLIIYNNCSVFVPLLCFCGIQLLVEAWRHVVYLWLCYTRTCIPYALYISYINIYVHIRLINIALRTAACVFALGVHKLFSEL